jgi:deoxycytidine triphosphate deaminase
MLKNLNKENIRPASVDLQLGQIFILLKVKLVDLEKNKLPEHREAKLPYTLKPGEYVLAKTIEELRQEKKKYACLLSPRSRAFRMGLSVQTNFFGPYYEGKIVFGIKNISESPIKLYKGMSLVQISFLEVKGQAVPVKHDYQFGKIL